ncbi:phenylalanine--tRNA ligase beta subunit-related protein [Streptomyces althioticus]|uniref:phenylalanine--tRNA ligase beta subunit-related protein n=1 Tax=Streptomyces althioticus TaxID=83380 RepID=UPI0033B20375
MATAFRLAHGVAGAFPDTLIAVVTATGLRGRESWPATTTALPAGAFDLDQVTGDVEIRYADGSESFTPLGEPGTVETPKPGEVIYTDTTDVLTRHWNHRDAHRTRVTEDSTRVAFVLETVAAARDEQLLKTAAGDLQALLQPHCDSSTVHYLSPAHPDATA